MNPRVADEADALRAVSYRVLGTPIHAVDRPQAVAWIDAWIAVGVGGHIVTINPELIMRARGDRSFREILERSKLNVPDGMGTVLAGRLQRVDVPERVTGVDLIWDLAALARDRGWTTLLVGGGPDIAQEAGRQLTAALPGLRPPEIHVGGPGPEHDAEARAVLDAHEPHLVFVAYGAPAQERWIQRNIVGRSPAVAIGVGGTLNFVSGRIPRAPAPLRALGMEWAFRLAREPWRWRRMRVLPEFAVLAVREAVRELRRKEPA